jgi:hypothetical protein
MSTMENNRAGRKPDPETKVGLRGKEASGRNPGLNVTKDGADMRVRNSPVNSKEQQDQPSGESRRPLTNQDEERNIVNGDSDEPMGEKEREGD